MYLTSKWHAKAGSLLTLAVMASCIAPEADNSEAAIDGCKGKDVQLAQISQQGRKVTLFVHKAANLAQQHLEFTLPQGAHITPDEWLPGDTGFTYDFSLPAHKRTFTVSSEDGAFNPVYTIEMLKAELPLHFHFEQLPSNDTERMFDVLYEMDDADSKGVWKVLQWASSNTGYRLTGVPQSREDYPALQTENGYRGKAVKLVTRSTGQFGASVGMPLAAGSLFVGNLNLAAAMSNPAASTTFGFPFYKEPLSLKGFYKYTPGKIFLENGVEKPNITDACDIYAVLYEAPTPDFTLNGTNIFTSPNVVSVARLGRKAATPQQWTTFDLPFERQQGKQLDPQKLEDGKYKLTIVFTSSAQGVTGSGAIGSTLLVDEVELVCRN